jgi:hypothetical protein
MIGRLPPAANSTKRTKGRACPPLRPVVETGGAADTVADETAYLFGLAGCVASSRHVVAVISTP